MPHCTGDLISGNENLNRPQTLGSPSVRFDSLHASSTAEVDLAFAKLGREPGSALIAAIPTSSLCVELPAKPAFGIKGAYFVDDPLSKMHMAQALAARSGRIAVGTFLVFAAWRGEQLALAPCATRLDSG